MLSCFFFHNVMMGLVGLSQRSTQFLFLHNFTTMSITEEKEHKSTLTWKFCLTGKVCPLNTKLFFCTICKECLFYMKFEFIIMGKECPFNTKTKFCLAGKAWLEFVLSSKHCPFNVTFEFFDWGEINFALNVESAPVTVVTNNKQSTIPWSSFH